MVVPELMFDRMLVVCSPSQLSVVADWAEAWALAVHEGGTDETRLRRFRLQLVVQGFDVDERTAVHVVEAFVDLLCERGLCVEEALGVILVLLRRRILKHWSTP